MVQELIHPFIQIDMKHSTSCERFTVYLLLLSVPLNNSFGFQGFPATLFQCHVSRYSSHSWTYINVLPKHLLLLILYHIIDQDFRLHISSSAFSLTHHLSRLSTAHFNLSTFSYSSLTKIFNHTLRPQHFLLLIIYHNFQSHASSPAIFYTHNLSSFSIANLISSILFLNQIFEIIRRHYS